MLGEPSGDGVEGVAVGAAADAKDGEAAAREEEGAGAEVGGGVSEPRGEEAGGGGGSAVLPRGGDEEDERFLGKVLGLVVWAIDDVECDAVGGEEAVEAAGEGFGGAGFGEKEDLRVRVRVRVGVEFVFKESEAARFVEAVEGGGGEESEECETSGD